MRLPRRIAICCAVGSLAVTTTCINPNERAGHHGVLLAVTTQPGNAVSGVMLPTQPVVEIRDSNNERVLGDTTSITATIGTGGNGNLAGTTTVKATDGVATFTDLTVNGAGVQVISFGATGEADVQSVSSSSFIVAQPPGTDVPAAQLTLQTQPAGAMSGSPLASQPVVRILDNVGLVITSGTSSTLTVTAERLTGTGTLSGTTSVAAVAGIATFTDLQITGAGIHSLRFTTATPALAVASNAFSVAVPPAGPATQLAVVAQPSTATSGVPFATTTLIEIRDAAGNVVGSNAVVTAALASGSGTLVGTKVVTAINGIANFGNLRINGSGPHTIAFTASGLSGATTTAINVVQVPASLTIETQPSGATSGLPFTTQPVLQVLDNAGLLIENSTLTVIATKSAGTGTLSPTPATVSAVDGVATFTNLTITGTGTHALTFSASGVPSVTSASFQVSTQIGPPTHVNVLTQPGGAVSAAPFTTQPVIQIRDVNNAVVTGSTAPVTVAIASGTGTLSGTTTVNASGGVATFTDLVITGTGSHTLIFTSPSLNSATSIGFSVAAAAGTPTQLVITTQPSGAASGAPFTTQPVVQIRDANNSLVSTATASVTATIASGTGTLSGTATVTASGGVATFSNLTITGSGAHTLQFTSTALTAATSNSITLSGAATKLSMSTQPSTTAVNGAVLAQQPAVRLRDAANVNVNQAGVVVTASIASGGGTLGGTKTATTNASGIATFTDLSITGTVGSKTLRFTATGLTNATSGSVSLTAGPATQLAVSTQPSISSVSGVPFSQQPAVRLRDVSGNDVSQSGVVVTATIASGGGTLDGTTTATTNSSGVAIFANLGITGAVGPRTLGFGATGLTGAVSNSVTISGPPTQLTITTQPSTSMPIGVSFTVQPVIQLRDASNLPVGQAGVAVTAAIASGGGTLSGASVVSTDANGVATFGDLAITGAVGDRTLSFSASGLTGATSNTISLTAGPIPWLVEDFSTYATTSILMADPRGIYSIGEDESPSSIQLDNSSPPTGGKSMRYDYTDRTSEGGSGTSGRCSSFTIGRNISLPASVKDVWIEMYLKFTTNFTTAAPSSWGCTSGAGLKLMFGRVTPSSRFDIGQIDISGDNTIGTWHGGWPGNEDAVSRNYSQTVQPYDGAWHRVRLHLKASTSGSDGAYEFWVDNVLINRSLNISTGSGTQIYGIALTRNMNQGPDHAQSLWWGGIRVYNTNPGW